MRKTTLGILLLLASAPARADVGASVAGGAGWDSDSEVVGFFLDEAELRGDVATGRGALRFGAEAHLKLRPADHAGPMTWDQLVEYAVASTGADAWRVQLGRNLSPLGWESVDMGDVPFATHGILYDYGSPTTITGALVWAALLPDLLEGTFWAANGLDLAAPQDRFCGGLRLDLAPVDGWSLGLAGLLDGPTADDSTLWLSTDATLDVDPLLLVAEATWGTASRARAHGGAGSWTGAMLLGRLARGRLGGSLRLEWFRDPTGVRTGDAPDPPAFHALAASLGLLVGREESLDGSHGVLEVRYDRSLEDDGWDAWRVTALIVVTTGATEDAGSGAD